MTEILPGVAGLGAGELVVIVLVLLVPCALLFLVVSVYRGLTGRSASTRDRPRASATRLAELRGLLDQGLVTQVENDARRQQIIDSV